MPEKKSVKRTKSTGKKKTRKGNATVFDDVYRTMVQKMPELMIPVINEIGMSGQGQQKQGGKQRPQQQGNGSQQNGAKVQLPTPNKRRFPPKQIPDSEATVPRDRSETPSF